ncbi:DUF11 domain-containing protein [Myxacorys almedinensis]|uniref:DUF11 domain-containing protein n=1 Tax=Myxacorys almedinensis A TaxID=2690445 RepID=A0A8J7Z0M3_9CYAN|nr:DUF11 domain-containing protein [Myxacorys almedinensis]NDJ16915.1 DUF11 domain-containing protein [Myxacorys almedinensis A]
MVHRKRCRFLTALLFLSIAFQPLAVKAASTILNTASYSFENAEKQTFTGFTNQLEQKLDDPFGQIRGCGGELLPDYAGFSVGVYEANINDTPTSLVPLTRTGVGTGFTGAPPNLQNSNPFFLANDAPKGAYNFFLNRTNGQIEVGKRYILIVSPPSNLKRYSQRQIRIVITARDNVANTVSYTATALDGRGISLDGDPASFSTTVTVSNAERTGLVLSALSLLDRPICVGASQPIQIIKTADRAAAEPGDTVIYRLSVRNLNTVASTQSEIVDQLPLGFSFLPKSVRGELAGNRVPITTNQSGSTVTFKFDGAIPPDGVLNVAYAVQLSPDSVRGSGENLASVSVRRADTNAVLRDGPSKYRLRIRPGIISDCGTLIGQVFEDKNFDGEQQPGEPGIANAVILLDDGTRITTDPNGIFSVANVLAGSRTGVLDLSSVPGYTFAPNRYIKERNSQSRLVRLEPSGLARMNFAVTPAAPEASKP